MAEEQKRIRVSPEEAQIIEELRARRAAEAPEPTPEPEPVAQAPDPDPDPTQLDPAAIEKADPSTVYVWEDGAQGFTDASVINAQIQQVRQTIAATKLNMELARRGLLDKGQAKHRNQYLDDLRAQTAVLSALVEIRLAHDGALPLPDLTSKEDAA